MHSVFPLVCAPGVCRRPHVVCLTAGPGSAAPPSRTQRNLPFAIQRV
ncbi:hypothetical protein CU044_2933 [Streptomyces sp. L-9-10]|nr:hypothetical protein CU044_2933 [Streptomyces sp. L-9-10]